jgi:hypothetical protein
MDGTLNGSAADVDGVAGDVSVSEPHAASSTSNGAADATTAAEVLRVKFTVATVQPHATAARIGGITLVVLSRRIEGMK